MSDTAEIVMPEISREVAKKVLETVDAGLVTGKGVPTPGKMCVEAAVCYALGLPHSDQPICVGEAVREFKIRLNDSHWPSNEARAQGMRKLAVAQLGSNTIDQWEFVNYVALHCQRRILPFVLRHAASFGDEGGKLEAAAVECESAPDLAAAKIATEKARKVANAYANAET